MYKINSINLSYASAFRLRLTLPLTKLFFVNFIQLFADFIAADAATIVS